MARHKANHDPTHMKLDKKTRAAILAKNKNHSCGVDGFCIHCKTVHRTDWKQNNLCPKLN